MIEGRGMVCGILASSYRLPLVSWDCDKAPWHPIAMMFVRKEQLQRFEKYNNQCIAKLNGA